MPTRVTIGLGMIIAVGVVLANVRGDEPVPEKSVTLLGTLAEWQYPGANFSGATVSDGGNRTLQSVKCVAVLTTEDSVEKVTKFYTQKFVSGPSEPGGSVPVAQSVSEQSDSEGRPVELRVIVVNRAESSTTLVISRAEGEKMTHIAWSHYMRLSGTR